MRHLTSCTTYLPFEAYATMPPPGWWPSKLPGEVVDQTFDLTTTLTPEQIVDLYSLSVDIYPSGTDELAPSQVWVSGTIATVTEYAGQPLRVYTIRFRAVISSGPEIEWTVQQAVRGSLPTDQPWTEPMSSYCSPVTWQTGQSLAPPARLLPTITVAATGTNQATAAPIATVSRVLVNANTTAGGGGIVLPPAASFCGQEMPVTNDSGSPAVVYPNGGDLFSGLTSGEGITLQNEQTTRIFVANSGLLIST